MSVELARGSRLTIHEVLKQYWGHDSFRPLQQDVINSVLAVSDTLAIMPMGGGKSLCYEFPGILNDFLCLVISPFISLMKSQVEDVAKKKITEYAIAAAIIGK